MILFYSHTHGIKVNTKRIVVDDKTSKKKHFRKKPWKWDVKYILTSEMLQAANNIFIESHSNIYFGSL